MIAEAAASVPVPEDDHLSVMQLAGQAGQSRSLTRGEAPMDVDSGPRAFSAKSLLQTFNTQVKVQNTTNVDARTYVQYNRQVQVGADPNAAMAIVAGITAQATQAVATAQASEQSARVQAEGAGAAVRAEAETVFLQRVAEINATWQKRYDETVGQAKAEIARTEFECANLLKARDEEMALFRAAVIAEQNRVSEEQLRVNKKWLQDSGNWSR